MLLHSVMMFSSVEPPMAADKVGVDQLKLETAAAGFADSPVHFKILQFPAKCAAKVLPASEAQPPAVAGSAPGLQTSSPSVVVIAKAPPPTASAKGQPQMTKAVLNQVTSLNQLTTLGRMVMITVPRSTAPPQNLSLTPHMPPSASSHQANIQIPPGEPCGLPCVANAHARALYPACCRTQLQLFDSVFDRNGVDPQ